jgi:hypothetical protein
MNKKNAFSAALFQICKVLVDEVEGYHFSQSGKHLRARQRGSSPMALKSCSRFISSTNFSA